MSFSQQQTLNFPGDSEMKHLIEHRDWTNTSLGTITQWPQNLKSLLSIMLNSKFPMFLFWGPEHICFYNDAYRPSLGTNGKHPGILGMKAVDAWSEIWDFIGPLIKKVSEGDSVWYENQLVPIYRNGSIEDVYWTFSYSPVPDQHGSIEGVLVTCVETTTNVILKRQLEENERKMRLSILQAPVAITIFRGPQHEVEMINSRALQLTGRTEHELLNRPLREGMPELESQPILEILDNVFATGESCNAVELPFQFNRDGLLHTAYLNFSLNPIYDPNSKITGIMAVGADVTTQMLAHKKVETSEEKLNIVIQASDLGTYEHNLKTRETTYSPRYLEILGYPPTAILTHDQILKHLHPDDLPVRERALKDALKTGNLHYEGRIIWNDGSIHWFEGRGKLFYADDGSPEKLIGTLRDITEEKQQEQLLRDSEQQFRDLIMESPVPKAILRGPDLIIETVNRAMLVTLLKKTDAEVTGKKLLDVFPELLHQKYPSLLREVYSSGQKWSEAEAQIKINGNQGVQQYYVDVEFAPLLGKDNSVHGIKLTAIDVTEKVEARKKIEESEWKYRQLSNSLEQKVLERTAELEQKNIDLQKMNKELQSFAYISSHDLQEPLRKIQTFTSRLLVKEVENMSERGKEDFARMRSAAERMQILIDDLLAYSRTSTTERKFEVTNLSHILKEVKEDLREDLHEKQPSIVAGHMVDIPVIPFQFRQLLQNLISNSIKFSSDQREPQIRIDSEIKKGGELKFDKLDPAKSYCHISVSDNGIGFEQQYAEKIFELFQRLHGRTEYQGTGIGLAIVKKIVENHNGFIRASGVPGEGATFDIYLPSQQ